VLTGGGVGWGCGAVAARHRGGAVAVRRAAWRSGGGRARGEYDAGAQMWRRDAVARGSTAAVNRPGDCSDGRGSSSGASASSVRFRSVK
jgi:hypothetical protein